MGRNVRMRGRDLRHLRFLTKSSLDLKTILNKNMPEISHPNYSQKTAHDELTQAHRSSLTRQSTGWRRSVCLKSKAADLKSRRGVARLQKR
jgi:hypothetical protein